MANVGLCVLKLRGARSRNGARQMRAGFENNPIVVAGSQICGLRALWKRTAWLRCAGSFATGGDEGQVCWLQSGC